MTEWDVVDALTPGDVSRFGMTWREAYEWLASRRDSHPRKNGQVQHTLNPPATSYRWTSHGSTAMADDQ